MTVTMEMIEQQILRLVSTTTGYVSGRVDVVSVDGSRTALLSLIRQYEQAATERALRIVLSLRPEVPESQLHTLLRDDACFYAGQHQIVDEAVRRIREKS